MYVVCKDHLELALEMFVDECEGAPDVVDLEREGALVSVQSHQRCARCEQSARYWVGLLAELSKLQED